MYCSKIWYWIILLKEGNQTKLLQTWFIVYNIYIYIQNCMQFSASFAPLAISGVVPDNRRK
jgi:hypothetical protein